MDIEFDLIKSVDENAGKYFDLAKKAKKKLKLSKFGSQNENFKTFEKD